MQKINLRDLYPDVYKTDAFVDVAEEVLAVIQSQQQAVSLGSGLKFLVVVVAVVAYVLDAMNQIVEMRHLMQKRGCQLEDGPVKVLGAEIDFPILLTAGVPYLVDTAPAIRPAPSVW